MKKYRVTICRPYHDLNYCIHCEVLAINEDNIQGALETFCLLEGINLNRYEITKIEEI